MAAFARGNIVVYRVGTGAAALTNTATAVFLDEYNPAGGLVQSIALPVADNGANQTLTAVGNSALEGLMSLSADGGALVFAGYDAAPGTAPLAAGVNRVIGRVRGDGVADTVTSVSLGSGNVRGVASVDGSSFYVSTSTTGVGYGAFGGAGVTQLYDNNTSGPLNARGLGVFGGQLYESSMSGAFRIAQVGTGTPTTAGQVATNIAGDPNANTVSAPGAFVLADLTDSVAGVDTLYVADSRSTTGGLYKYSLVGGSWVSNGSSTLLGLTGLTGSAASGAMTLFGTTSASVVRFLDTSGYNGALAVNAQQIAGATANTAFRGIAFAPSEAGVSIGTINFATTSITRGEGEGGETTSYTYTVVRSGSTAAAATVGYSVGQTVGTTTLTGDDFAGGVLPAGSVAFAAGQDSAQIVVTVANDQLIEGSESFTITLSGPSAGYDIGAGTARGAILNDDFAGAFSIARTTDATEGGNATFTLTRTGGTGGPVDVAFSVVADGTATAADFVNGTLPSGTVRFEGGQTSATISVATFDDTIVEGAETFSVRLDSASNGGTLSTATAQGSILDNDVLPTLTISDPSVVEGTPPGAGGILRFTVTASTPAPSGGITFDIATADGSALAGSDYTARSVTSATIAAGQTSYTFDVLVTADATPERAETVLVNLSNARGANIGDAQGIGTIVNDDDAPQGPQLLYATSFDGFTAAGFAPGATTGGRLDSNVFRVLGMSDLAAPAYGFTSPAAGAAANDFGRGVIQGSADPTSGGVYSPSANPALVVQPTGSDFVEGNGAIEARIQNASGFTATSFEVGFDWTYRNSGGRADGLQLSYSSDGVTFTAVPSTAFTTPGAADATVAATFTNTAVLAAISDVVVADGGYLYLRWNHTGSSGSGNRDEIGIDNLAVRAGVTDAPTLTFADVAVAEGNGGTSFATITLTRTSVEGSASIGYATADGVALAGSDYVAQSGTVTFAAGEATKTIQVAILGDTRNEPNETFFVNFSNPTGFLLPDNQARVTILNEDTGPVAIYDIQGLGHRSSYEGLTVQTSGVVTALRTTGSDRGYYLQDATGDNDSRTSDAIFVSTGAVSPTVAVGNAITLTGTVAEYTANAANLTVTRLTGTSGLTVTNAAAALPAATLISTEAGGYAPPTQVIDDDRLQSYDPATDGIDYYESLEGMLVTVRAPLVVSTTDAIGQTYVVANGGIGATGINERYGITISPGDNAPEKLKIYAPGGGTFDQGDVLGDVSGILTYFGSASGTSASYEIDPLSPLTVTTDRPAPSRETSTLVGDATHLTIASFNVENADPGDGAQKFQAIATEVTQALRNPDVIGVQEIQDADGAGTGTDTSGLATAQAIIDAIVAAGGPRYRYTEIAPAYGTTGGEPGGNIRNGYLYNPERVQLVDDSVRLIEDQAFTGSRRPLVAEFVFNGEVVTVVNAHSTSRGGSDTLFGAIQPPAQAGDGSRTAQATAIKGYLDAIQAVSPNAHVVTVGDFNGYYYEAALSRLTADGKFTNLYSLLPVEERYSYLFEGYVQAFDNVVVSNNLTGGASFDVVHYNAEQPSTVYRVTDHDQALARLYVPGANTAPTDLAISASTVAENLAAGTLVGTVVGRDAEGGVLRYSLSDDAGGRFAIDAVTGQVTTRVMLDFEAASSHVITARVTDAGGLFLDKQLMVTVTDVTPENVVGTDASETAIGGAGNDVFTMRGGNDWVDGGAGFDTVVFGYTLGQATTITRTGIHALAITGPEGTDTLVGVEALRFSNGTVNLDDTNPFVDNLYYLQRNPDVLASGMDPANHYAWFGVQEGRDPDAFFSTRGYLASNPDVARVSVDPLDQYRYFGASEGRDPSANFDTQLYLLHNPDVARAGLNPLVHFLDYGRYEGRATYAAIGQAIDANAFDAEYYLLRNPDVAGSGMTAYQHYLYFGRYEGRDPNALFNTAGYLQANPDVAANGINPLEHYNNFGWHEGRDPSESFDTKAYLTANPDVAASGLNPLTHYLDYGAFELRDPHADGMLTGTNTIIG